MTQLNVEITEEAKAPPQYQHYWHHLGRAERQGAVRLPDGRTQYPSQAPDLTAHNNRRPTYVITRMRVLSDKEDLIRCLRCGAEERIRIQPQQSPLGYEEWWKRKKTNYPCAVIHLARRTRLLRRKTPTQARCGYTMQWILGGNATPPAAGWIQRDTNEPSEWQHPPSQVDCIECLQARQMSIPWLKRIMEIGSLLTPRATPQAQPRREEGKR